jgi:hypothetical protein
MRSNYVTAISCFRRHVNEICAPLGYHAVSSVNTLPTFRDNISVPSSRVKKPKKKGISSPLEMVPIRCPETSVKYYQSKLRDILEERRYNYGS